MGGRSLSFASIVWIVCRKLHDERWPSFCGLRILFSFLASYVSYAEHCMMSCGLYRVVFCSLIFAGSLESYTPSSLLALYMHSSEDFGISFHCTFLESFLCTEDSCAAALCRAHFGSELRFLHLIPSVILLHNGLKDSIFLLECKMNRM